MKYDEIRPRIKTFDILLFSGGGLISKAIQLATGSEWSHVAIAMRLPDYDQVLAYESTTLSDLPDLTTGARVKGVQLVQLSDRIRGYDGDVAVRHLIGIRDHGMLRRAGEFMREFQGRPYEKNQVELMRAALDKITLKKNQPDASSVFCSEMAVLLLRRVGILADGDTPANEFTPADLAGDLDLLGGFRNSAVRPIEA